MGTQHARRVVVKKNTSTEVCATIIQRKNTESTESSVNKISGLYKHAQQQLHGIECMQEPNIHKQYACGCPSLLDSVIMFCHKCSSAYMLCVCMCVCVYASVCSRMVKVHLHNVHIHKGV